MDNTSQPGLPERSQGGGTHLNGASHRRPQTLMSPIGVERNKIDEIELTITIQKDASGYGMKVSGDKPVFVESVKAGGAAHKAGLMERDMIVKVNGEEAKTLNHTRVVHLIKDKSPVILTVSRVQNKMQRSSSISVGTPTPLAQRGGITAPLPVDSSTRREVEFTRISTLRLMLDQEKKNLENLKSSNNGNRNEITQAETNILRLQEQLRQMHGEDSTLLHFNPIVSPALLSSSSSAAPVQSVSIQAPQSSLTPAFLSRFPRSLSSLSLGGKKKSTDKDLANASLIAQNACVNTDQHLLQAPGLHHHSSHQALLSSVKNKFCPETTTVELRPGFVDKNRSKQVQSQPQPPPLPLRNFTRRSQPAPVQQHHPDGVDGDIGDTSSSAVTAAAAAAASAIAVKKKGKSSATDNDNKTNNNENKSSSNSSNSSSKNSSSAAGGGGGSSSASKVKKRSKAKIKANSDPKISAQLFIQMERECDKQDLIAATGVSVANEPPPLPPRQPGMLEENQNKLNNNKCSGQSRHENRPASNSLETRMNYPLIATATAVRDNISPFPLSNRPNIRQRLQQQQQQQQQHQSSTHQHALDFINQMNNTSPHRRVVSSPEQHIHSRDSDTFDDETGTPPGTPPPPYKIKSKSCDGKYPVHHSKRNYNFQSTNSQPCLNESVQNQSNPHNLSEQDEFTTCDSIFNTSAMSAASFGSSSGGVGGGGGTGTANSSIQRQIISMEDDELGDDSELISDDHGPFKSLQQLLEQENSCYLAVFLNFVLSNSNPSQLLFYLITGLYKEGTVKDMRKWAYEIHSTFLVPRAPLMWEGVDESLAREVDNVLQNEHDKGEILRKIFWKSRHRAKECIIQQLAEFQMKRTAGLGTMFGPSDQQLLEAKSDKIKEQRIVEETLLPKLQQLIDDLDKESPNECPKKMALSSALSTVLHRSFSRSTPASGGPIDRVHHFVSREKSFKSRLIGKSRTKVMMRGHHLVLKQYYEVAHCNHCQNIIWGVSPQGYHCTNCELNIHRACSRILEESCPGPVPTKNDKMSKFIERIRPAHYFNPAERARRQEDECGTDDLLQVDRPTQASVTRQPSDRRSDTNSSLNASAHSTHANTNDLNTTHSIDNDTSVPDADHDSHDCAKSKSAPVSVNRSESYKERLSHKRNNRNNRRKISDPSLSSKSNDDQHVDLGINNTNFTASSSSSLSSSLGSNSPSLEAVGTPIGHQVACTPRQWVDSEDEAGEPEADWSSHVSADILQTLSDTEKRRQEIINEIYQTERNHVRTLRLLEGIFMRPLQESSALTLEHFNLLFPPSLLQLKDLHSSFEQQLKQRRIDDGPLVGDIGDLLLSMFDGGMGEQLLEHAAQFCARQKIALEALKEKRRKDENLQRLLTKAESHKACRRLQLKDLLPTVLQRLTKYPLLFESLAKISRSVAPDNEKEIHAIQRARELSRRILDHVNQAVREAEDTHTLQSIQKRLDKSLYEKEPNNEFKNLDLTQHKLIYEGTLTHKKQPREQLHGLLFETMVVLLHKQDDKYILKHLVSPGSTGGESKNEIRFNPITKINLILVRQSAVEKNSFYLINTNVTQMLELTAPSALECKTWFNHISAAAEAYKQRTKNNHDIATVIEDPSSVTIPTSATAKETSEHEFIGSAANLSLNTSNANATTEGADHHTQLQDGQRVDTSQYGTSHDNEAFEREHDYINVNGSSARAILKSEEDNKLNSKKSEHYSTNSNNTRTLTQQSSLVAPSEVHVSISPALVAKPVLTPNERLRRLDESIRTTLAEKQKIVCDIFHVPNEHFSAIADIAGQPEAPKEPSDILLAAFAQVQLLTEALNEYIKIPQLNPAEMLVKSASLCDDCYKMAEKQHQTNNKLTQSQNSSPCIGIISSTTSVSSVIDKEQADAVVESADAAAAAVVPEPEISPDDDGYCEIDEIRLPAITKSPSIKIMDPRRQSAPASLPPNELKESIEQTQKNDATNTTTTTPTTTTTTTVTTITKPNHEHNKSTTSHTDAISDEQTLNVSSPPSSSGSVQTVLSNKHDAAEHIEINNAYDSLTQSLSALNLNCDKTACLPGSNLVGMQSTLPPCDLLLKLLPYVTSLNLHISQLLPKINERDIEREKLRKENQVLRDRLNLLHEREFTQSEN